jgi:2,3-bisphosphoglycerate-independent phosphoglycerate mutase
MRLAKEQKLSQVYLHLISDGRDSGPTSSPLYIAQVQNEIKEIGIGEIATVMGRYYAMDRDHRWERIKVAYDALISGVGEQSPDVLATIAARHAQKENDEFIKPIFPLHNGQPSPRIGAGDSVIFFNYRIDRPRELTRALTMTDEDFVHHTESFDPYGVKYHKSHLVETPVSTSIFERPNRPTDLCFVSMTEYEKNLPVEVAFPPEFVEMPLSRVIALAGRRQLKLAESEKERFVTYYFNGQRELAFPGEDVQITPSPKVATYDLMPEMSGVEQTNKLLHAIDGDLYDLIVINYPNPDMVAHTGNLEASIKACSFVDTCIQKVYERVMQKESVTMLITADHGNVEELISLENGGVDTEHSGFPVPLLIVGRQFLNGSKALSRGVLADVAPTILKILDLDKPSSMSGRSLL